MRRCCPVITRGNTDEGGICVELSPFAQLGLCFQCVVVFVLWIGERELSESDHISDIRPEDAVGEEELISSTATPSTISESAVETLASSLLGFVRTYAQPMAFVLLATFHDPLRTILKPVLLLEPSLASSTPVINDNTANANTAGDSATSDPSPPAAVLVPVNTATVSAAPTTPFLQLGLQPARTRISAPMEKLWTGVLHFFLIPTRDEVLRHEQRLADEATAAAAAAASTPTLAEVAASTPTLAEVAPESAAVAVGPVEDTRLCLPTMTALTIFAYSVLIVAKFVVARRCQPVRQIQAEHSAALVPQQYISGQIQDSTVVVDDVLVPIHDGSPSGFSPPLPLVTMRSPPRVVPRVNVETPRPHSVASSEPTHGIRFDGRATPRSAQQKQPPTPTPQRKASTVVVALPEAVSNKVLQSFVTVACLRGHRHIVVSDLNEGELSVQPNTVVDVVGDVRTHVEAMRAVRLPTRSPLVVVGISSRRFSDSYTLFAFEHPRHALYVFDTAADASNAQWCDVRVFVESDRQQDLISRLSVVLYDRARKEAARVGSPGRTLAGAMRKD